MSLISKKLRAVEDGGLMFWCPGCDAPHIVWVGTGKGPRWSWDKNAERPTFSPSLLVQSKQGEPPFGKDSETDRQIRSGQIVQRLVDVRCHTYIRAGRIEFLSDCTHSLAGQAVDIPDWEGLNPA